MGSPAQLSASAAGSGSGEISALLSYPDGRQAAVLASGLMPKGYPFSVGFRALFEGALFELANVFADDGPPQSRFTVADDSSGPRDVPIIGHNPYAMELQRFVDCIEGRATPDLLDVDRAIEALNLSLATQQALAQSQAIPIGS
jgi:UDP-N-acetylglucosamine 3-dehydrogenase